jgi:hypothetical protein
MKTRLLRKLRNEAKKKIEVCCNVGLGWEYSYRVKMLSEKDGLIHTVYDCCNFYKNKESCPLCKGCVGLLEPHNRYTAESVIKQGRCAVESGVYYSVLLRRAAIESKRINLLAKAKQL